MLCGKHVVGVACAATYSCAWTRGGDLYTWGYYRSEKQTVPTALSMLRGNKVVDVACMDSYILVLTDAGKKKLAMKVELEMPRWLLYYGHSVSISVNMPTLSIYLSKILSI